MPARSATSFVCPYCGAESWNPNDIIEGYCGRCHRFADDPDPFAEERAEARRDERQRVLFGDAEPGGRARLG